MPLPYVFGLACSCRHSKQNVRRGRNSKLRAHLVTSNSIACRSELRRGK